MYNIKELIKKEAVLKDNFKQHFVTFFQQFSYETLNKSGIKLTPIESHDSLLSVRYGSGLYLILTDYIKDSNPCNLEIGELKVIYRGHGRRIRKRVESHLYNSKYTNKSDGTNYTVCMKLNDDNGINLNEKPYSDYKWAVVQHPMTDSSKTMREQAEQGFDEVYNMPIGSNA
ncbi:hypothetical protein [Shewanella pealeana]|uniref:Uncharacterized protein n=1 Tax=Shewanella pealeana (strain ATCC 700345 / ANG-SQ1) TaxID=398579 RepID=A8H083_SHEPA|nr:hypothetical protein [Shewanella pealeana]ABV85970.1 hypothetical protein Spea_0643 [Shewanella pealeana ATCC 700345]